MGTVGISFGSPTSGTGFDVSATVSQIVGNLKSVETPWKTQLTSLESQDTAMSGLGVLFSKLSSDLSSLTDFTGVMAQKTGASSDSSVLQLTAASTSSSAGTHTVVVNNLAQTSSGYLDEIADPADQLSGTFSITVNGGTQSFDLTKLPKQTLAALASAINSSGMGVRANILSDASGSRLSLVSNSSGINGQMQVSSTVTDASIASPTNLSGALSYNSTVDGKNASLVVDGVPLSSATNIVANLIPGLTFQMLSASPVDSSGIKTGVQVVIGNDNPGVESTINAMVIDYNSVVSAINAQQGNDDLGKPEPLYGSPTLSLLQQQLLGGINKQNPNGYLDSITNSSDALSGSIDIKVAGGLQLGYFGTAGANADTVTGASATTSAGTLAPIMNSGDTLSGSISIRVGSGSSQTVKIGDSSTPDTLAGLAQAINSASIGVAAAVVTNSDGSSSLSLTSGTSGTAGTLTVDSSIVDTTTQTVQVPSSPGNNTLAGMAAAINSAHAGVTANILTDASGSRLVLVSGIAGLGGALKVTSLIVDNTSTKTLAYSDGGSDISALSALGISMNNDGSIKLDMASLDTALNTDFSGVTGFFQNANSWGRTFSTLLDNAGTTSSKGILTLAKNSNSTMETNLSAYISKEESIISAQEKRLTTELNAANQIMQALPSQLASTSMLYSAITGYNQNRG